MIDGQFIQTNQREAFAAHVQALERHPARHNFMLGLLINACLGDDHALRLWSFGGSHCAVQVPARPIVLGDLTRAQCRELADITTAAGYPGVAGPDRTAHWFVERATELGLRFRCAMPQGIFALKTSPAAPKVAGELRQAGQADLPVFARWMTDFLQEAVPHEQLPSNDGLAARIRHQPCWFWIHDGRPVSLAAVAYRTPSVAAIVAVYTPPCWRGRGFATAVVASAAARAFLGGATLVCLYADLRNRASNRCYATVGFRPVCPSWLFLRETSPASPRKP